MNSPSSTGTAQRRELRIPSPRLKIAVVQRRLFWIKERDYCDLLDISRGGVSIASRWLKLQVGQKVNLELHFESETFPTRGVVTHSALNGKRHHYGLTFIYAPQEVDRLIDIFFAEHLKNSVTPQPTAQRNPKRHMGKRIALQDTGIGVKKLGSTEPYAVCRIENISKGGMAFSCPNKIDKQAPFDVSVQMFELPTDILISGRVHYMEEKANGYYYGMEYTTIPTELARLLENQDGLRENE